MNEADLALLRGSFKKYYFDHHGLVRVPERPERREFGYQRFDSGMIRHLSVRDDNEMRVLLMENVPSDIYCSNGYYLSPTLEMKDKDWQGADLIFDIDAKDLQLPCRKDHTFHKCTDCGTAYTGKPTCPKCDSAKYRSGSVACPKCIGAAKAETARLLEILDADLAIRGDIGVYFSGNEGFHIHAAAPAYRELNSRERAELRDYIMFYGAIPETFGMTRNRPERGSFAEFGEPGWRGRIAKELYGSKSARPKAITGIIAAGYQALAQRLQQMPQTAGVRIDPNVTTDVHRIFRMPGSLNGKSGLTKMACDDIDKCSPYEQACLIDDDPVDVIASSPVKFKLKGTSFGPYSSEKVSVPRFAAVYMICKGLATSEIPGPA